MDHGEIWRQVIELVAFCGRYGSFAPPWSLEADLRYLRAYAEAIGGFIEQETRKRHHR